jgi:hypothetical protein
VKRFADAGVLAAVADRAVATTLVTSEGRALTEVILTVQNRAQPFLKVSLPPGTTMVSVDVAGQSAKPVLGSDGTRVPLLRQGFRPTGPYRVSFVYLHAGTPFAKKGDVEMTLPKMDMPVGIVEWELFAPERYAMKTIGGNAIDVNRLRAEEAYAGDIAAGLPKPLSRVSEAAVDGSLLGQIRGVARDRSGAVLSGATIEVASPSGVRTTVTDSNGRFVMTNVQSGQTTVTASLNGFSTARYAFDFDQRPRELNIELGIGNVTETVTVMGETPIVDVQTSARQMALRSESETQSRPRVDPNPIVAPSLNVVDLQRRATGVLPVRVDVPRTGTSHQFVKPLVVDQETTVRLRYKRR